MPEGDKWLNDYERDPEFLFEMASTAVGELIVEALERLRINRTELAKRVGVSRPRITQILAGEENLTLKTLVAVATALEAELKLSFEPLASGSLAVPLGWRDVPASGAPGNNRQLALAA